MIKYRRAFNFAVATITALISIAMMIKGDYSKGQILLTASLSGMNVFLGMI